MFQQPRARSVQAMTQSIQIKERRRHGRLKQPDLQCSAGVVLDLSAGGVRVLTKRPLKGKTHITFYLGERHRVDADCQIIWCKRIGFRTHLVGLQFLNLPMASARRLLQYGVCTDGSRLNSGQSKRPGVMGVIAGLLLLLGGVIAQFAEMEDGGHWFVGSYGLAAWLHYMSISLGVLGGVTLLYTLVRQVRLPMQSSGYEMTRKRLQVINERRDPRYILDSILESALGGVLILEAVRDKTHETITDFSIQRVNPAAEKLVSRSEMDLVGRRLNHALPCIGEAGLFEKAISVVASGMPLEDSIQFKQNERWYRYAIVKVGDGLAVTFDDVSDQRASEAKLRHAAYHDALTGLPNRKLLTEHLMQAIHRAERVEDYKFAVLFLDFDRFKIINDSLGHEAGDQLLLNITKRLRENLRELDTTARLGGEHLPSRLGGDEFVVLLDGIRDDQDAATVAQRLLKAFSEPYQIMDHEVTSTASIGIVVGTSDYTSPDAILRDADTAMYHAKSTGKARFVMFDEKMHRSIVNRLKLENDLRIAVEAGSFQVMYEPIIELASGAIEGLEALIRWQHPERGLVAPGDFIEIAEELGLMGRLGQWVLQRACTDYVKLCQEHPKQAPDFLNVNVSRTQLRDPGLVGHIHAIMLETGIKPGQLRLEVTESMVMDDLEHMAEVLNKLKELGVGLAMDDFGTGHSSLTCLHKFPLDVLKIDRSFINSAGRKERYYGAILYSVIELATNLDMTVIAEGIENANQLALLQGLGCKYGQGYLFSEAVRVDEVSPLLDRSYTHFDAA